MSQKRTGVQTLKGNPMTLIGPALESGTAAPEFSVVKNDMSEVALSSLKGKLCVLNVVPSLETPVCDTQTRRFNEEAAKLGDNVVILTVSKDLPFSQKKWCAAAGVERVHTVSDFRGSFGEAYGVLIGDGPLAGLLARAVFLVDGSGKLVYQQICSELAEEPDYGAVLEAVQKFA